MGTIERRIAAEAKFMTRAEVIMKALEGHITWLQAADILGVTPRHVRRIRSSVQKIGLDVLRDHRASTPRRKRVSAATVAELCRLRRDKYADFSIQHFY